MQHRERLVRALALHPLVHAVLGVGIGPVGVDARRLGDDEQVLVLEPDPRLRHRRSLGIAAADHRQELARLHLIAGGHQHVTHHPVGPADDGVLHLHGLEHDHGLARDTRSPGWHSTP